MRKGLLLAERTISLAKKVDVCIVVSRRTLQPSLILQKGLKDFFADWLMVNCYKTTQPKEAILFCGQQVLITPPRVAD